MIVMNMVKTQIGTSSSADFEENTWTFEMQRTFSVSAGKFAIVPLSAYNDTLILLEEIKDLSDKNVDMKNIKNKIEHIQLKLEN